MSELLGPSNSPKQHEHAQRRRLSGHVRSAANRAERERGTADCNDGQEVADKSGHIRHIALSVRSACWFSEVEVCDFASVVRNCTYSNQTMRWGVVPAMPTGKTCRRGP